MSFVDAQQPLKLYDLLKSHKSEINAALRVCLPITVTKVNLDGTVNVQPTLIQVTPQPGNPDGLSSPYPELQNCPVHTSQGGGIGFVPPVSVGDAGMIFFADRNLDAWKINGTPAPLPDCRMHDLSDGIVIIGLNVLTNPLLVPQVPAPPSPTEGGIKELVILTNPATSAASAAVVVDTATHLVSIRNANASLLQILAGLASTMQSANAPTNSIVSALIVLLNSVIAVNTALAAASATIPSVATVATAQNVILNPVVPILAASATATQSGLASTVTDVPKLLY